MWWFLSNQFIYFSIDVVLYLCPPFGDCSPSPSHHQHQHDMMCVGGCLSVCLSVVVWMIRFHFCGRASQLIYFWAKSTHTYAHDHTHTWLVRYVACSWYDWFSIRIRIHAEIVEECEWNRQANKRPSIEWNRVGVPFRLALLRLKSWVPSIGLWSEKFQKQSIRRGWPWSDLDAEKF